MPQKKPLIIVESPAKTKTLKNFLGGAYDIHASVGHVRDLPKSRLGVDVEHDFQPSYSIIRDRKKVVEDLRKAAAKASEVYIASDPDREGEAIAWHVAEALKLDEPKRIEFNEITKSAVTEAFRHPRTIDEKRVGAQQARRVLDRLVGYKISPLLWTRVKRNLSAGRVQSVAVRLICEREREIQGFVPVEYWTLTARLTPQDQVFPFEARLLTIDKDKASLSNEGEAQAVVEELQGETYRVDKITRTERKRNAPAPFITSTLQQEASRKLGFGSMRTMRAAQDLYEGIELGGEGSVGLITYLRTDSTRVSPEAVAECRSYVTDKYGSEYLPGSPRVHKSSNKSAQDAHECIRPTSVLREPAALKSFLSSDQFKLYTLIWQRFVASQMNPALYDVERVDIQAGRFGFRATGSTEKFKGFRVLYSEGTDDKKEVDDEDRPPLPSMTEEQVLKLLELVPDQHFTEPPPRYTEATLVKTLEEKGIGRPSTYASIVSTIRDRGYVVLEQKRFKPTDLGFTVNDLLVKHFPSILDVSFTANVETQLDEVENGKADWVSLLREFYGPFEKALGEAQEKMERVKVEPRESDELCPKCGRKMLIRQSRSGEEFLGCSGYPECKTTKSLQPPLDVKCPTCHEGDVIQRRSKRGKIFFGCNRWPDCDFVSWDKPVSEPCPQCGGLMVDKTTKARGHEVRCTVEGCGYSRPVVEKPESEDEAA
ncbi:MAG: type I DNA topoisomerase [Armatimonadetes bacterium]|nr:type I DNA topoisomerase [Armatimonadota bacterium]